MGKVIAVEYLSLDGVMEEPGWSGLYFNDEVAKFQYDNLFESDALLLGRVTYEGFKAAWPTMEGTGDFGERMNGIRKYVATNTLTEPEWNATFLSGDVAAQISRIKGATNETLLINGSAELFTYLGDRGLIDEYRFMVFPVVVGSGKHLFEEGKGRAFTLIKSQITTSGVAILTYTPAE